MAFDGEKSYKELLTWVKLSADASTTSDKKEMLLAELINGKDFVQICEKIDSNFFDECWKVKVSACSQENQLQEIMKALLRFYSDVLGEKDKNEIFHVSSESLELGDKSSVSRLIQLMLYCAVNGCNKASVIENILSMDANVQNVVMQAIQQVTTLNAKGRSSSGLSDSSQTGGSIHSEHIPQQLASFMQEKEQLISRCCELDQQLMQSCHEKDQLSAALQNMEEKLVLEQDEKLKNMLASEKLSELLDELTNVREELFKTEMQRDELTYSERALLDRIEEFEERENHYEQQMKELRDLRDESDEMRSSLTKLSR